MAATGVLEAAAVARYMALGQRVADAFVRELRNACPPNDDKTRNAIRGTVGISGAGTIQITLEAPTPQAVFTNAGTRPHRIGARNKKAISFNSGGMKVTVNYAMHPGTRPTHWWDDVLLRRDAIIQQALA